MAHDPKRLRLSIRALLGVLLSLLAGCSQGDAPSEPIAESGEVLTFPLTITLSTPSPVAPTAPVLNGSNSVRFQAAGEVVNGVTVAMGSGGVATDPDALLNETWSRGPAVLKDRSKVRGTLHAKSRTLVNGATVTTWDQTPSFDPPSTLSWSVSYPSGTATAVTVNSGSRTLEPGKYGNVTVNSPGTITLKSGTYYMTTLVVQSAAVVKLDQGKGPVIVYDTDGVTLRGSFVPLAGTGTDPNLLIAHLGTQPVVVETLFKGSLVAPSATVTLRSVTGTHTGFFYAKDLALDAHAKVAYKTPLALVGASAPPGPQCRVLLAGQVPEADIHLYCHAGCIDRADTDRDGVEDCVDACPYDPLKKVADRCPCGVPDIDQDSDGTPDCLDDCELDPNVTHAGECGCLSDRDGVPERAPAGTKCVLKGCPSTGASTCDGQGVCGNRAACVPATGCKLVQYERGSYWICPGPVNQAAAALACRNKQMPLVRINGFQENHFLRRMLASAGSKPVWIGANSITTSGAWRWTSSTNNNGDLFWQGGATGTQQNDLFSAWNQGAPAAQRCAQFLPATGRWIDVDCTQTAGFVCEYQAETPPGTPIPLPGAPKQPPAETSVCMSNAAAGLPAEDSGDPGLAQMAAEYRDSYDNDHHTGIAAMPPPENTDTCLDDPGADALGDTGAGAGCSFTVLSPPDFSCFENADCTTAYGATAVCRQVKDVPTCKTSEGDCHSTSRCGTLSCPGRFARCDQKEICNPAEEFTVADVDTDSDLGPDEFDPDDLFPGGVPVVTPAPAYNDPPFPQGLPKDHPWCFMNPQEPVKNATQPDKQKNGKGGGSSRISFSFDPHLEFHANANPISLGESDLDVHASASLETKVHLNDFIKQTFTKDVLKAKADVRAQRCTISNDETQFTVFGLDFVELLGVPKFNTAGQNSPFRAKTQACNEAVGTFIETANRAKKAFRDVQQLLSQLKAAKDGNGNLRSLCESIMTVVGTAGVDVPFFPGGFNCPANEPSEITINRFLDYYQAPGFGTISRLRDAVKKLSEATDFLRNGWNQELTFGPKPRSESKTIVQAQFQIGPVPVVLEVDVFYSYGAAGYFKFGLHFPYDPFSQEAVQRQPIADVRAGVMPFATAGLSAFVGAGKSLGPFSATLGIEGVVTLGDVRAPIFGGAGIGMETTKDVRPPASDLAGLAQAALATVGLDNFTHFGPPKSVKFFVWYDYGAALELRNILSGEIKGRLRISFAFFSRTWRKRIVKFNGFSKSFALLSGKAGVDPAVSTETKSIGYKDKNGNDAAASTLVVEGTNDVGMSEAQVPLMVLQPVEVPDSVPAPSPNDKDFSKADVQDLFYDNLCCAKPGDMVAAGQDQCTLPEMRAERGGAVPCCPGFRCDKGDGSGTRCVFDCRTNGATCSESTQCCAIENHDVSCGGDGTCQKCGHPSTDPSAGAPCGDDRECCGWDAPNSRVVCASNHCAIECRNKDEYCADVTECCHPAKTNVKCNDNSACEVCGIVGSVVGAGGPCNTASDCCGYTGDGTIACTAGECLVHVN